MKTQLRQTYYDKVYNYRPSWIIRWGLLVISLIMTAVFCGAWFVQYPDTVTATAEVTTLNPPVNVTARVNGEIAKLWVKDGDSIPAESNLAMLETTVSWEDYLLVNKYLSQMDSCIYYDSVVVERNFRTDLSLGELQPYYNDLINNYIEYIKFDKYSYGKKEIAANQKLLASKQTLWKEQNEQEKVYNEIYNLSRTDHYRDMELWASGIISETQMEQSKMGLLQKESAVKDLEITKITTISDIRQMEYNIEVLKAKDNEEKQQRIEALKQAISQFTSQLDAWKQNFVITSPIRGKVTFTNYWVENQNVKAGDIVMSIVPIAAMQTVVRVQFPMNNAGKVHISQRVNIKLENYPYSEFGLLQGVISSVSEVPDNNYLYTATVTLDKGLITSYNKKLNSGVFLKGAAEILTDDYSLLLRLFNPLKAFYDEKLKP